MNLIIAAMLSVSTGILMPEPPEARQVDAAPAAGEISGAADFDRLVDRYFDDVYFRYQPTEGTAVGLHRHDDRLEDYSREAIRARIDALRRIRAEFEAIDPKGLPPIAAADRELVLGDIDGTLLMLERSRPWQKNPLMYPAEICRAAYTLIARDYAPPEDRLRGLIARERLMPAALEEARANLEGPPRLYTEVALEQLPGFVEFFERDLPAAFAGVGDEPLRAEFAESNRAVIESLRAYQGFLREDLLPRSNGDYRIGADLFRERLLREHMVDTPLDRLLELGMEDLRRNQAEFRRTAAELDPAKDPMQVLHELEAMHPEPGELLQSFRDVLGGCAASSRRSVCSPSRRPSRRRSERPRRSGGRCSSPRSTGRAPSSGARRRSSTSRCPSRTGRRGASRSTWPPSTSGRSSVPPSTKRTPATTSSSSGSGRRPSKVRKLLGSGSNSEGWAHYAEQMMLEAGYGRPGVGARDRRESLLLRLGQLQDALLRNARFVVAIRMHTGQMSFEEGVKFFVEEGYQTETNALRETRRGAFSPTYLMYTLGKLQILKLREDYRRKRGDRFTLREFHDEFLKQGYPPIKIVRKAMLGEDGPSL